jgi:hypothetical protein
MCSIGAAMVGTAVVGAAISAYSASQQASASKQQSQDIFAANKSQQAAQSQAFNDRIDAGMRQTAAQTAAQQETLNARSAAATQMREGQMTALKNYQDTLAAENAQTDTLRQTGDTAAQQLLQQTNAANLQGAQNASQQQAAALLAPSTPQGPEATDPSGGNNAVTSDATNQAASARRTAEAATNIRNYGSKIAAVQSYAAPIQAVGQAITANQTGLMPAQAAETLLRGGSATRLLPSQVAYGAATGTGQALDVLLQSKGQNALDAAGLSYGNATDLANLRQGDADTLTANKLAQQTADLSYAKAQAGILGNFGNLAANAGARYLASPSSADPNTTNFSSIFASKPDPATAY